MAYAGRFCSRAGCAESLVDRGTDPDVEHHAGIGPAGRDGSGVSARCPVLVPAVGDVFALDSTADPGRPPHLVSSFPQAFAPSGCSRRPGDQHHQADLAVHAGYFLGQPIGSRARSSCSMLWCWKPQACHWPGDFHGGWVEWDVELLGDAWHRIHVRTATEELGWPRRFTRARCTASLTDTARLSLLFVLSWIGAGSLTGSLWGCVVGLLAFASLLVTGGISRRRCLQAALSLLRRASLRAGFTHSPERNWPQEEFDQGEEPFPEQRKIFAVQSAHPPAVGRSAQNPLRPFMLSSRISDFKLLRRVLGETRPYRKRVLAVFVLGLLATPIALLAPVPLKIAVDSVVGSKPLPEFLLPFIPGFAQETASDRLKLSIALLLVVALLHATAMGRLLAVEHRHRGKTGALVPLQTVSARAAAVLGLSRFPWFDGNDLSHPIRCPRHSVDRRRWADPAGHVRIETCRDGLCHGAARLGPAPWSP